MSIFEASRSPWTDRVLSIFRIVAGFMFVTYGTMKLFDYPHIGYPGFPVHDLLTKTGIAGILETFGGLLITLGLLTRPVAFILSGEMAFAYFLGHASKSFFPTINEGTPAVFYCFFFLYLIFAGAGPWSIDALIARSRRA